jgi:hypothetical protein
MSVALHGNLTDFGIAEVFQLIGQQRKTGVLEVNGEDSAICLLFDQGQVVRGGPLSSESAREPLAAQLVRAGYLTREQLKKLERESERSARPISALILAEGVIDSDTLQEVQFLLTRETVFDVMRRKSGDFHFTAEAVHHDTKPENLLGAEQILMDGLRMLDEWQTFVSIVPSQSIVFRRVGDLESYRAVATNDGDARFGSAERVLQLVDGRLDVRRIVDLSRIGTFEATRALAELREAGIIDEIATSKRRPSKVHSTAPRASALALLRVALATVLPFVALAMLGLSALERGGETFGPAGSLLPEPLYRLSQVRHETQLLRNLVEVHFFEKGRYPATLEEIGPELARVSDSLTSSQLADYYYVVRDDEVILLAPMH